MFKKRYILLSLLLLGAIAMLTIPKCRLVSRMVWYNFADVGDYQIFNARELKAAATPFHFAQSKRNYTPLLDSLHKGDFSKADLPKGDFAKFLAENSTLAFIIIKNDSIIYEKYLNDYDTTSIVPSFSMAKSYTSTLIGCAIADGYIGSTADAVTKYLPEMQANGFDKVTLNHVLQMTSGIDYDESYTNPFADAAEFYYGEQLRNSTLTLKLKNKPGTTFEYTSGNTEILGLILERVLAKTQHKTVTNYLQTKLWQPLGCEFDASWSIDNTGADGIEKTFCCINARARDYAKMGSLFLHKGNWHGQQLVPAAWVENVTKIDTTAGGDTGYSHQWWIPSHERGDFTARGLLGQYIYVNPHKNVVIVRLGANKGSVDWLHWLSDFAEKL